MSLGHDPELPAGLQDADIQAAQLNSRARRRQAPPVEKAEITAMELESGACNPFLRALVECDGTEYTRNFPPELQAADILSDFRQCWQYWAVI